MKPDKGLHCKHVSTIPHNLIWGNGSIVFNLNSMLAFLVSDIDVGLLKIFSF